MAPKIQKQWVLSHFILLGLLSLAILQFWGVRDGQLKLAFLDVGQGDAVLIQTSERHTVLVDAGPGSTIVDRLGEEFGFFDKTIDLFVMTHPDQDHFAGILDVLERYDIRQVLMTGVVSDNKSYAIFLAKVKAREIKIILPTADRDIQISPMVYLDVIFPFKGQSFWGQNVEERNDTSIVLRLRRKTTRGSWENLAMLPGDAGVAEEREILLSGQSVQSPLLKLGHHGSKTSSSPVWLKAVRPDVAVVSAGRNNSYGHPHQEVLDRLSGLEIRNTAHDGTLHFTF